MAGVMVIAADGAVGRRGRVRGHGRRALGLERASRAYPVIAGVAALALIAFVATGTLPTLDRTPGAGVLWSAGRGGEDVRPATQELLFLVNGGRDEGAEPMAPPLRRNVIPQQ